MVRLLVEISSPDYILHTCLPSFLSFAAVQWLEVNANIAVDQVYIFFFSVDVGYVAGYISSMMNIIHTV